jgi:hypothetical protein
VTLHELDVFVAEARPVMGVPGALAAVAAAHLDGELARQAERIEQRTGDLENALLSHAGADRSMLLVRRFLVDGAHAVGARRLLLRERRDGMQREPQQGTAQEHWQLRSAHFR